MKYGEIYTYIQLFRFNGIYYIQMRLRVPGKIPINFHTVGWDFCYACRVRVFAEVGEQMEFFYEGFSALSNRQTNRNRPLLILPLRFWRGRSQIISSVERFFKINRYLCSRFGFPFPVGMRK